MTAPDVPENDRDRRSFVKRWAAYVRNHDDEEWSRQQNELIDSQLRSANEMARRGETDPVRFYRAVDGRDAVARRDPLAERGGPPSE